MPVPTIRDRTKFSGAKLRAAREAAGYSLEELAIVSDRATETMRGYELGKFTIPPLVARACARLLGIPLSELAEDERPQRVRR